MKSFVTAILIQLAIFWGSAATADLMPLTAKTLKELLPSQKSQAAGKRVTVVNLWATWCAPCEKEMPQLIEFAKKNAPRGVRLILVTADEPEDRKKAADFLTKLGADFPIYFLAESPDKFMSPFIKNWSSVVPTTVLFNRRGEKSFSWVSEIKFKDLQDRVDSLLVP
jgi:thiol-disulfide isomerase/thioredoxin